MDRALRLESVTALCFLVLDEFGLGHPIAVPARQPHRFKHVFEIVGVPPLALLCIHNSIASLRTWARYLTGRSPGVSKSTDTPRTSSSSVWIAPISSRVAPGSGST